MTLNVSLTPQLEEMVKVKVQSGMYNSASELVREALRLIEERDRFRALQYAEMKKAIEEGMKDPGVPAEEVFAAVRARIQVIADQKKH